MVGLLGFEPRLDAFWARSLCQIGVEARGVRGGIRTRNNVVLSHVRLPNCATRTFWWVRSELNRLGSSVRTTGLRSALAPYESTHPIELSKICRKAGDSNAYVPKGLP